MNEKENDEFGINNRAKDGYRGICKVCRSKYRKQYYQKKTRPGGVLSAA